VHLVGFYYKTTEVVFLFNSPNRTIFQFSRNKEHVLHSVVKPAQVRSSRRVQNAFKLLSTVPDFHIRIHHWLYCSYTSHSPF